MNISEISIESPPNASTTGEEDRELYLLLGGFAFFQALVTACRLNLFSYLSKNAGAKLEQIARELGIPEHSARVLLLASTALRLLNRDSKAGYNLSPLAERAFLPDRPGNVQPLLEAFARLHYPALAFTTESIKEGKNVGLECFPGAGSTLYERLSGNPELEGVFHGWMRYLDGIGHSWLAVPELGAAKHLVDVGGGTGPNALLARQFYPDLRITIFDLPTVCAIVDQKIERWGTAGQGIRTQAGDFLADPFPSGADALVFVRIFNIYSPETNRRLLRKCREQLPSGGSVIISNLFSSDDETGPLSAAHLSLYFQVLATGEGMVYPMKDYAQWFREAGFDELRVYLIGRDRVLVGIRA